MGPAIGPAAFEGPEVREAFMADDPDAGGASAQARKFMADLIRLPAGGLLQAPVSCGFMVAASALTPRRSASSPTAARRRAGAWAPYI
jgi:copper oxidase (laccase) domain-containing protein